MKNNTLSLNGVWLADYISNSPYKSENEPYLDKSLDSVTPISVPGYWEDMTDLFRTTSLHTKLSWNPLYTLQRYPQAGYVPDMALPNPYGAFVYSKEFELPEGEKICEAELYVGGVQNTLSAWINGKYLGIHEGYSSEFFLKVPENALKEGKNSLTLAVSNNRLEGYKDRPVSGLSSRAANECTGGIWGDVELRFHPDGLRDVWVSTAEDTASFTIKCVGAAPTEKNVRIYDGNKEIYSQTIPAGECELTVSSVGYSLWSPSSPKLYTVSVETAGERLVRRFGIRRLTSCGTKLYLNGSPYIFRGTCEHLYQPKTVHPTRDKGYYRQVIRTLKELGFNSLRFHTWVPMPEYMEAADELGFVIEVETPNNTTYAEWQDIVNSCRHFASVCAYSSGNEMVIDEEYIEHLRACASYVHSESDSLFSPMSAMRGIEYHSFGDCRVDTPITHNPERLAKLSEFADMYNSYSLGLLSYESTDGDPSLLDERNSIYKKPILSHEICIQGTYQDLSLKDRYKGTRIGDTEFITSVEAHLDSVGLLDKAPLYYKNSAAWQRVIRKSCFETLRQADSFAGYDFLGDIDTHWHTFGYCVGMMNEFYELKPGETVQNVLRYNSDTVLLCELPKLPNVYFGSKVSLPISVSNYGEPLDRATLTLSVRCSEGVFYRREIRLSDIPSGEISKLYTVEFTVPKLEKPEILKISARLSGGDTDAENEWQLYAFPKAKAASPRALRAAGVSLISDIDADSLMSKLRAGESVVLLGAGPLPSVNVSFQLSIAGRTTGHLATVIADHPITSDFAHEGFCSWQFSKMMNEGSAVILDYNKGAHEPIIDIATTYKNARREALLFEARVGEGRLLVCSLGLSDEDPAAVWLKSKILDYAMSDEFSPKLSFTPLEFAKILATESVIEEANANMAENKNDITMKN